jgi:uncharacterized repeat protein (TIGR03803 family)
MLVMRYQRVYNAAMQALRIVALSSAIVLTTHLIAAQTLTTLYTFTNLGGDGDSPQGALVMGPGGVLYGVTEYGGTAGYGSVFQLTPPAEPGGTWNETTLYSFKGLSAGDGEFPGAALTLAGDGVLYGTTTNGGGGPCKIGCGIAFSLTPPASPGGAWTETILHEFGLAAGAGFRYPSSLVIGPHGGLYGTTQGTIGPPDMGTVFRLNPPTVAGGKWTQTVLHRFTGGSADGSYPNGVISIAGSLYGTTAGGGPTNGGTVFELTPPAAGATAWTEALLYSFPGGQGLDNTPANNVVAGANGVLYGTTFSGTVAGPGCYGECGAVFELVPPAEPGGTWTETNLYNFTGSWTGDGQFPDGLLYINGVLYGTTSQGGPANWGTIFQLTPPAESGGSWSESVLYSFTGSSDGATPGTLMTASGNLYGVNSQAGLGYGTVFELIP